MEKFTLPISPEYVAHWGLWEAVREIYQNALDEQTTNPYCVAAIDYADETISISTTIGQLSPETLVLGRSSKRDDPNLRGKFGEGYKLALLVLARLGFPVQIASGSSKWSARIEHDERFNSDVLNIYIEPSEACEGVTFKIEGIAPEQWEQVSANIQSHMPVHSGEILNDPKETGRVYAGGLYVATVKEFRYGYSFRPETIRLDRDRGMVDGFDLAYETSRLWADRGGIESVRLINEKAPDVQYVETHVTPSSALAVSSLDFFHSSYGTSAVPVCSQDEIERASRAGLKWVLVPETLKAILRTVKSWFIPSTQPPLERLKAFRDKYRWQMTSGMLLDLEEIIESFGSKIEEKKIAA